MNLRQTSIVLKFDDGGYNQRVRRFGFNDCAAISLELIQKPDFSSVEKVQPGFRFVANVAGPTCSADGPIK